MLLAAFVCVAGCGSDSGSRQSTPEPSSRSQPPPVTEPTDTLAGYTQACGVELGPVPGFDCASGALVPITVDGVDAADPGKCDRPSLVRGCGIPTRVGRLNGRTWDDAPDPDVSWVFMCSTMSERTPVVLIGQHQQTGATCFFESHAENAETVVPAPLPPPEEAAVARDDFWLTPELVANVGCPSCHTADPWVHTPYIDQLRDPDNADLPLVPSGADRSRPYFAVASPFEGWPRQVSLEGNACLGCHRIGTGARLASDLVRHFTNRSNFFLSSWGQQWPQSHWMPPTGASSAADWEAMYGDDVTAILDCLGATSQDHCTIPMPSSR